jgi:predicted transposase/invertase (TIGR01784 family)
MRTDSLFYRLFQHWPGLIMELAGLEGIEPSGYTFRSEEIKQTAFRIDGLAVPPVATPEHPLIFVEVQFQPDAAFYPRFLAEIFLYLYRTEPAQPWQSVVIYPDRRAEHTPAAAYAAILNTCPFKRVYLEDFLQIPATTMGVHLIQLITCPEEEAVSRARACLSQANHSPLEEDRLIELIETPKSATGFFRQEKTSLNE